MFLGPVSTWLQSNGWASAQASPIQQVITEQVATSSSFANTQSDYFLGSASLAATAAARRLHAAGKPEPVAVASLIAAGGNIIDKLA